MAVKAAAMATVAVTDAVAATRAVAKVVETTVQMVAVKAVAKAARPARNSGQKAAVRPKANAQNAMVAMAADATIAMSVANAVATPASNAQSAWTSTPRHQASSCLAQPSHALSALPAMSAVIAVANVAKAVAANATSPVPHAKTVASAMPKVVLKKAWHSAQTVTTQSPRPTDATSNAAVMDVVAMAAVTSVVLAKKKAATTRSNLRQASRLQSPRHPSPQRLCPSKARMQKLQRPHKARDADLGNLVPAIVMVVNVAIAQTVQNQLRLSQSTKKVSALQRQCPHRLQRVWLRPLRPSSRQLLWL
jgi:hypothetical protein